MMFHNLSIMHETFQATLRKDFYEKDVHVYWVQGNLKGKKLSLGHCTDMQVFGDHVTLYHTLKINSYQLSELLI